MLKKDSKRINIEQSCLQESESTVSLSQSRLSILAIRMYSSKFLNIMAICKTSTNKSPKRSMRMPKLWRFARGCRVLILLIHLQWRFMIRLTWLTFLIRWLVWDRVALAPSTWRQKNLSQSICRKFKKLCNQTTLTKVVIVQKWNSKINGNVLLLLVKFLMIC